MTDLEAGTDSGGNASSDRNFISPHCDPSLLDWMGDEGRTHVLRRYESDRTFLNVIFGFYITVFVAFVIFISSSTIVISNHIAAYIGLILFVIVMSVSGFSISLEIHRFDSMWPIDKEDHCIGKHSIGKFVNGIKKDMIQFERIKICQRLELIETLLISSLLTSLGLIVLDFVDAMLGIIIIFVSILSWIIFIRSLGRVYFWHVLINRPNKVKKEQ